MKRSVYVYLGMGLLQMICFLEVACAKTAGYTTNSDSLLRTEIQKQFKSKSIAASLYFPQTVKDFYKQNGFEPAWIKTQTEAGPTWQAMLMIDCVLEYGLAYNDYHPKELTYDKLRDILEKPRSINIVQQAQFDILLSDAIITLMNHLHYGKLNPLYSAAKIDKGNIDNFHADVSLTMAMANTKNYTFLNAIAAVQPRSKEYAALQYRMHLIKGQYQDDCYEVPEAEIRKIAINMERLRWAGIQEDIYLLINIPSYTLKYYQSDTVYQFKVIVGKPSDPTPTFFSKVESFTTAPDWTILKRTFVKELLPKAKADTNYLLDNHFAIYDNTGTYMLPTPANLVIIKDKPDNYYVRQSIGCDNTLGNIVFRFANPYGIYLHDTPERQLFKKEERSYSYGCIRVEQPEKLAALLLQNDGQEDMMDQLQAAIKENRKKSFILNKHVPIKVIYLTCEMKDGVLVTYKDIYDLDKSLEMALYNTSQLLTIR